jgi:hypothetical protein
MASSSSPASDTPAGPEGVWLEYADGARYENLPTVFQGIDDDGLATFEVIPPREEAPMSAGAALWPGMTSLVLPVLAPGAEPS